MAHHAHVPIDVDVPLVVCDSHVMGC
jgi:hypothetical protein